MNASFGPDLEALVEIPLDPDFFAAQDIRLATKAIGRIPYTALNAVFIVLLLRTFLRRTSARPDPSFAGLAKAMLALFLFDVALTAIVSAPVQLLDRAIEDPLAWTATHLLIVAYLCAILVQMWVYSRLCLVYPHAALGRGVPIRKCWRATSGYGIRLTGMLLAVVVPLSYAAEYLPDWIRSLDAPDALGPRASLVALVVNAGLVVFLTTVLAALGSMVFTRLTEQPGVGIPDDDRAKDHFAAIFD